MSEDALSDALKARCQSDRTQPTSLQEEDVRAVIHNLYEAADALDSTWPDADSADKAKLARDTKAGKAVKGKSKERQSEPEAEEVEDMGEEAFEATYPRVKDPIESLAGRLDKTGVKDNMAVGSVSEYEDKDEEYCVRKQGRFRRG